MSLRKRNYIIESSKKIIGYKVMPIVGNTLISGADSRQKFPARKGCVIKGAGKGTFLSLNKQYVLDYYSGRSDNEALLTLEFDPEDIAFGNLTDRETEIAVKAAKILKIEKLYLDESILSEDDEQRRLRASAIGDDYRLPNVHKIIPYSRMKNIPYNGQSEITIYRGVSKNDPAKQIRSGDWVTLKKSYAAQHGDGKVLERRVPAIDVSWAGTDENEWFYTPLRKGIK